MARGKKKESVLTPEEKLAQALVPESEQPYQVPENWCWTKIGAVSDFERGITFPASAKESEASEDNIPCLRTANVQENLEIDDLIYVNRGFMKSNEAKLVRENDIIMSSANSRELVGKSSFVTHVPFPMTFGGFVLNIRACGISSKYLFYFLRHEFLAGKFMGESTQTTNIANINTTTLGDYELPLPPLAEQQRIVDRIEYLFAKLDEAKEKAQSVLDSFETRKAAILHKAFTGELTAKWRAERGVGMDSWKPTTAEKLFSYVTSGSRGWAQYYAESGAVFIRMGNLDHGTIELDMSDIQYVQLPDKAEGQRSLIQKNDILISITADVGMIGFVRDIDFEAYINQHVALARPAIPESAEFIAWYLVSDVGLRQFKNKQRGATKIGLGLNDIRTLSLDMPLQNEQTEIVRILSNLFAKEEQAKEAAEAVLDQIDLLKKSILARAFRGELGTNDPNEERAVELIKTTLSEKLSKDKAKGKREKKKPEVEFVAKTIMQALSAGGKITPEKLKSETGLLIDDFYDQLKTLINSGCVIETRIDEESYLEAKNEDRQPNN